MASSEMSDKSNLKHIVVSVENYQRLASRGKAGQSFNDVITEVLKKEGGTN